MELSKVLILKSASNAKQFEINKMRGKAPKVE